MARQTKDVFVSVWRMPILVTLVSSGALVIGLLGDGMADVVAWLGAGLPIALTLWHLARYFFGSGSSP